MNKLACHEKDTKESKYEQIISHLLVKTHIKQYYRRWLLQEQYKKMNLKYLSGLDSNTT